MSSFKNLIEKTSEMVALIAEEELDRGKPGNNVASEVDS